MQEFLHAPYAGLTARTNSPHFDTKNSVLMTWPPGLLGPKVLLAAATSMMPSEREDFAAEQAADRARRVLPPIILP